MNSNSESDATRLPRLRRLAYLLLHHGSGFQKSVIMDAGRKEITIDVLDFPTGIYFLRCSRIQRSERLREICQGNGLRKSILMHFLVRELKLSAARDGLDA